MSSAWQEMNIVVSYRILVFCPSQQTHAPARLKTGIPRTQQAIWLSTESCIWGPLWLPWHACLLAG